MTDERANRSEIWDRDGELTPLSDAWFALPPQGDVAVIVVSKDRPDLVEQSVRQVASMGRGLKVDTYVIEMGTAPENLTPHTSLRYEDRDFRGKCYGHNVGLRLALARGPYRYYWFLMNDLVFPAGEDTLGIMLSVMEGRPEIGVMSPAEPEGPYASCAPQPGREYHPVSTCDYLALLVSGECVAACGFLNPAFKYSWGAIHEYARKVYAAGWLVAYCDRASMTHLGGTTYGKVAGAPDREEYQTRAKQFAARYFVESYGKEWDRLFSQVLPEGIAINTFTRHRRLWESALDEVERKTLQPAGSPAVNSDLDRRIEALHPWYYDVRIGSAQVTPGVGARETPDALRQRRRYSERIWVDEVAARYPFRGKRILDIASNCAYFSSRYVIRGAVSVTAVEGRAVYVEQGKLYWGTNGFLPEDRIRFIHGDVTDGGVWKRVREGGPYDFTLCCGILYHVPDGDVLLRRIADVTAEAMLVDTRVGIGGEIVVEPGGWSFDAIARTREKRIPTLDALQALLEELDFSCERIRIPGAVPPGMQGGDDYAADRRVTLLATRRKGRAHVS